jgi:hypothetical protein
MGRTGGGRLKAFTLIFLNKALRRAVSCQVGSAVSYRDASDRLPGARESEAEFVKIGCVAVQQADILCG